MLNRDGGLCPREQAVKCRECFENFGTCIRGRDDQKGKPNDEKVLLDL